MILKIQGWPRYLPHNWLQQSPWANTCKRYLTMRELRRNRSDWLSPGYATPSRMRNARDFRQKSHCRDKIAVSLTRVVFAFWVATRQIFSTAPKLLKRGGTFVLWILTWLRAFGATPNKHRKKNFYLFIAIGAEMFSSILRLHIPTKNKLLRFPPIENCFSNINW